MNNSNSNNQVGEPKRQAWTVLQSLNIRSFSEYGLRTKIAIFIMLSAGLTAVALGLFAYFRTNTTNNFLNDQLETVVQEQIEQALNNTAQVEADAADQTLAAIANDVSVLATHAQNLLQQQSTLGQSAYWVADQELSRMGAGQWGNSTEGPASVYMPSAVELTEEIGAELNAVKYLDFSAPGILQSHSSAVAAYFINNEGATIYYPNVDLANVVGDFDVTTGSWFQVASPENNPDSMGVWTEPYQDPALTGLLITASSPVYDNAGEFRGVVSVDVQLARITEQIAGVQIGETGFAFLMDKDGRLIAMPDAGYQDLGLTPEDVPINEVPQLSILGYGPADFQAVTAKMASGEQGLTTIEFNGTERYFAYQPLPSTGFSLGVVVPVAEMNAVLTTAGQRIESETNLTLSLGAGLLGLLMLAALGISVFLGGVLASPLEQLRLAAQEIASGNFDVTAEVRSKDEIGVLARTFNDMAAQLKSSIGQLDRRNRAIETATVVGRNLSTILDSQRLAVEVVNQIQQAFNYYHAHIYLLDERNQILNMAGGTGKAGAEMLAGGHAIPVGKGLVGRAAANRATVLVSDVSVEEGWLPNPLLPETKSEAAVPIMAGDQLLGVLDVQHNMVDGLRQLDVEMLQTVANQVAIGLRNANSLQQVKQAAENEHIVNEISQKIENAATIEDVLNVAARELRQTLGAKHTIVELSSPVVTNLN